MGKRKLRNVRQRNCEMRMGTQDTEPGPGCKTKREQAAFSSRNNRTKRSSGERYFALDCCGSKRFIEHGKREPLAHRELEVRRVISGLGVPARKPKRFP